MYNHDPRRCHAAVIFRRTVDVVLKLASTTVVFCSNAIICHGVSRKSGTAMAVVAVAVPMPLINVTASEEFFLLLTEAHIVTAAMTLFKMNSLNDEPFCAEIPDKAQLPALRCLVLHTSCY